MEPTPAQAAAVELDFEFFEAHPDLRTCIRPTVVGEFGDDAPYSGHVLVTQLYRGVFERRAVNYRAMVTLAAILLWL